MPELFRKALEALNAMVSLRNCTSVGKFTRVAGKVIVENNGKLVLGKKVKIRGTHVPVELAVYPNATLTIGDNTFINSGASICAQSSIHIGKNCAIGNYSMVIDTDFHAVGDIFGPAKTAPIVIGDNVWIAAHVVILKGVNIGDNAVVAAGSVITKDIPPCTLVGGVPAKVIRMIE
jgi:acetyltransferase-like isoleucine patch superfamily enzyme